MTSTTVTFDKVPYLNVFPLETRFPFLSPDDSHKRSRPATLACTRIAILGSLKASRLQGIHHGSGEPSKFALTSRHGGGGGLKSENQPGHSESSIFNLLTNPITEPILLSYLTTHDLIALRQTSRFLRTNIDRQHRLWRTINLSYPRTITAPDPLTSTRSNFVNDPLRYLSKIINNHAPNTPISPYYHTRVLILDNYPFQKIHQQVVEGLLYRIFTNQCLLTNLKMLSIRGFWSLNVGQIAGYLKDWEVGIRGEFRKTYGWRFVDTPDGGSQVVDRAGKIVEKEEWSKKRGWSLEVFRFAGPGLLKGVMGFPQSRNSRKIPVLVPSYLSIPCDGEIDENGALRYTSYDEPYVPVPLRRTDWSNTCDLIWAMKRADRIGLEIDVGFCKNEEGHAKAKFGFRDVSDAWWGICERRWEKCITQGCRWEGWTEACTNCRWNENWCCKGCYSWVCEDCREKKRNDFGQKGIWCGGVAEKCSVVEGKVIEPDLST